MRLWRVDFYEHDSKTVVIAAVCQAVDGFAALIKARELTKEPYGLGSASARLLEEE